MIFLLPLGVPHSDSASESDLAIYGVSLYALKQIGNEAIPLLIAALGSNDKTTASKAVDSLGAIDTPEAIAAVTAALQDQRETVRDRANIALSRLKDRHTLSRLKDRYTLPASDSEVQHDTAQQSEDVHQSTVIASGENSQDFLSYVSSLNTDPDTNALALASVSSQMIPSIIQSLQAKEARIRGFAAYALAEKGSEAAVAVPDLTALILREPDFSVCYIAAYALVRMGTAASAASPALSSAFQAEDAGTRECAAYALRNVGVATPAVISNLIKVLKDPDSSVHHEALLALADLKDAVPKLTEMLQQSDLQTRRDASYALRRIVELVDFDPAATPILVKALQDPDEGVRINLAMALGKTIVPIEEPDDDRPISIFSEKSSSSDPFSSFDPLVRAVQAVLSGGH